MSDILARHGDYSSRSGRLTGHGRGQAERLGHAIREIIDGCSVYMVSSTAPRATDSAAVLKNVLGLERFEGMPLLWTSDRNPEGFDYDLFGGREKVGAAIDERRDRADGLILVGHMELARYFAPFFLRGEFGEYKGPGDIGEGRAIHADIDGKNYQVIPK